MIGAKFVRSLSAVGVLLISGLVMETAAMAGPVITVFGAPAPNDAGSPSFPGWANNALTGLEDSVQSMSTPAAGNPATATQPTDFFTVTNLTDRQNIVSGFTSWLGQANPTGAFASELGNKLHFPVIINGNGTKISMSELSFAMSSSDVPPNGGNTFSFTGNFADPANNVYTSPFPVWAGYNKTSPTTYQFITGGAPTDLFDGLIYIGVGNSLAPFYAPGDPVPPPQGQLDDVAAYYDSIIPFGITTEYSLLDSSGSNTVYFTPEPRGLALIVIGIVSLAGFRWRTRQLP